MKRIAIVGGGPGGLFTAHLLRELLGDDMAFTIFEASNRTGGKVTTQSFAGHGALYEAGVAEIYDYSHFGPDPLKNLVETLGLTTLPMAGPAVILGDIVVRDFADIAPKLGDKTAAAVAGFYQTCEELCAPAHYFDDHYQNDNAHPWADLSLRAVLDRIGDDAARHYIETAIHSDVATEPHLTSALNGLKNVLMEDPRYMSVYAIAGGIEQLTIRLAEGLSAELRHDTRVTAIARAGDGYRLAAAGGDGPAEPVFDIVICALPDSWLSQMAWEDRDLRLAMQAHIAHYDRPAHYLRITALFEKPFWRDIVPGSYFMHDAFGGCCLYDETSRHPSDAGHGVLSWLVAGTPALTLNNLPDADLIAMALAALPRPLAEGRALFREGCVNRWTGAINGLPGGNPVHDTLRRHQPSAARDPNLFVVGDYLYDSTLNGVYDSADFVARTIMTKIRKAEYIAREALEPGADGDAVPDAYFDAYANDSSYSQSFEEHFCEEWTCDLIEAVWGGVPPYKLLDCGSANGLTLEAFARKNVEAWGIENSRYIHAQTPAKWRARNLLGDVCKLPFADNSFDFVYETCLCYLPPDKIDQAIQELFRVCRIGVYCGSISTDMTKTLIEEEDLLYGVRTFATMLEWAEFYQRNGFRLAIGDPGVLNRVWQIEREANEGYATWYPDAETMRYCFFSKPDVPIRTLATPRPRRSAIVAEAQRPRSNT